HRARAVEAERSREPRVAGEERDVIAARPLAKMRGESVIELAKRGLIPDALAVGRIRDDPRVPAALELEVERVAALDLELALEACRAQVLVRAGVGRRVLLRASQDELLSWRVQRRPPRLVLQPLPRARVVPGQALERESRTREPGRHVSRDEGRLDEDRPRARERIDERRAPIHLERGTVPAASVSASGAVPWKRLHPRL